MTATSSGPTVTGGEARSRPGGLLGWVASVVRRHWLLVCLLAGGTVLRVMAQAAYRPALLYIDSYRYLGQLWSLDPHGLDPIGYDALVLRPLLAIGGLHLVTAAQHLTGLAMAVAIYALLVHRGAWRWLAALATVPVLLDAYQVQIEQNIMSDEPFQVLLVALVVVLAWRRRPGPVLAGVAGILLAALASVRLVALPLVVPVIVYLVVVAGPLRNRAAWGRRAVTVVAAGGLFTLGIVGYAAYYRSWTGRWGVSPSQNYMLYGQLATFADCAALPLSPLERTLCPAAPVGQRRGADYYSHAAASPLNRSPVSTLPLAQRNAVVDGFNATVEAHQPLDLAAAVGIDFLKGFRWRMANAPGDPPVQRWQFQTTYPAYPLIRPPPPAAVQVVFLLRLLGYPGYTVVHPLAVALRGYQLSVGYVPGTLLGLMGLIGVAGVFTPRRRRPHLRAACFLVCALDLTLLVVAAIPEFSWRYQLPSLVLLPLAGALGVVAWRRPEEPGTGPPARGGTAGTSDPVDTPRGGSAGNAGAGRATRGG